MAEVNGPKIYTYLFGNQNLPITETMVNYWIVMAFILFLCIFLTSRMGKKSQKVSRPSPKKSC